MNFRRRREGRRNGQDAEEGVGEGVTVNVGGVALENGVVDTLMMEREKTRKGTGEEGDNMWELCVGVFVEIGQKK